MLLSSTFSSTSLPATDSAEIEYLEAAAALLAAVVVVKALDRETSRKLTPRMPMAELFIRLVARDTCCLDIII